MADEQFLTTDEVLDRLNINQRTIYRLINSGKLPAYRVGRQWRVRRSDLDAFLKRNSRDSLRSERPRVLLVDDEEPVRTLVTRALETADYDVEAFEDGPSAVARLEDGGIDLLITDLKMPGMDGLAVIREARRRDDDLPIIIITGHSTEASAIEAINLGVSGYLTKPFRMPRVLAVTARALGQPMRAEA